MLSKNKVKYLKSLQLKKYRLQERKFVVEGDKIIRELVHSIYDIESVFATKDWIEEHKVFLKPIQDRVFEADRRALKSVSSFSTFSEVIAEVKMPNPKPTSSNETQNFILYLDGIRDPGNLGTIIRTAAWFGLSHLYCSSDCVDFYNNKVLQSTMGSFAHIDLVTLDSPTLREHFPKHQLIGATLTGTPLPRFDSPENFILIIGNEGKGIGANLLETCDQEITIPKAQNSKTESLNAAISTSIFLNAFCLK